MGKEECAIEKSITVESYVVAVLVLEAQQQYPY